MCKCVGRLFLVTTNILFWHLGVASKMGFFRTLSLLGAHLTEVCGVPMWTTSPCHHTGSGLIEVFKSLFNGSEKTSVPTGMNEECVCVHKLAAG